MAREASSVGTGCGVGFGLVFGVIAAVMLILFLMCAGIGSGLSQLETDTPPRPSPPEPEPPQFRIPDREIIPQPDERPHDADEHTPPRLTPEEAAIPVIVTAPPLKTGEREPPSLLDARFDVTLSNGKVLEVVSQRDEGNSYVFGTRNGGSIRYPKVLVRGIEAR